MAVPFSEIMEIKNFLTQQHITVSQEWVEACINFVKEDQGHTIPLQNLKKSVYQQWLVADLEEIACSSLPRELPTVQQITLKNNFALQVQGIRDISRPAYSQLKQLEGSLNSNEEFRTDPKAAVPEWEAKPTRMLLLNLTDGCTYVQGMEYRTINFLSPNLSPGIKVLIKGPIECRFGILLLTSDHIRILGGEVESKLQLFSRENILREQLQTETDDTSQEENVTNSIPMNSHQEPSNNSRNTNRNSFPNTIQQNNSSTNASSQISLSSEQSFERNTEDILEHFESDVDDFEQNIDCEMLDIIENSQRQESNNIVPGVLYDDSDMWHEDEDMVRDIMEFQDRNEDFKVPFELHNANQQKEVFTYLSTVVNNPSSNCQITIKAFIISVLSKLECTPSKGWSVMVKINDGTATVTANMHDKVLENIIGVSAQDMMKKQKEAAKNIEVRKEVMQAISKCKLTLQNSNCLMDVKFTPGEKPCIVKCYPVSNLNIQQLLERVHCNF